jgi:hypothetical protein
MKQTNEATILFWEKLKFEPVRVYIEDWRLTKRRLQIEHPKAKVTYKKGQFKIAYNLPSNIELISYSMKDITANR